MIYFWSHLSYIAISGRLVPWLETFPDKRSFVRQVKVPTKTAVYERPVDKLCLLVEDECPSAGNMDTKN